MGDCEADAVKSFYENDIRGLNVCSTENSKGMW